MWYGNHMKLPHVVAYTIVVILLTLLADDQMRNHGLASNLSVRREPDIIEHVSKGVYTNPLLACGDIESLSVGAIETVKRDVAKIIDSRKKAGHASQVSVYVRDLNNGPWFGYDEKMLFYPASLLKVPLLFAAYKVEEEHPGFLDSEVKFEKPMVGDLAQLFPPSQKIEVGKSYALKELLRRSVVYSDNEATTLLATHVGPEPALEVFDDFGIEKPKPGEGYRISVRNYGAFFRVLYNASYISRKSSEEALRFLSEVDFRGALVAGVPAGTPVAHKFGERTGLEGNQVQVHDCGIVYTDRPYLICVMAQGASEDGIVDTIKEISRAVYEGFEASKE